MIREMKVIAPALAALALTSCKTETSQVPQGFNLICEGEALIDGEYHKVDAVLRVDLGSKRYCQESKVHGCVPGPIQEVTPDEIILADDRLAKGKSRRDFMWVMDRINRHTGIRERRTFHPPTNDPFASVRYTCEKAPFTGLPEAKF